MTEKQVKISKFPIELYKVLQIANLADSGGLAKYFIAGGEVRVNGETELRKRYKCQMGDVIAFHGETLTLKADE